MTTITIKSGLKKNNYVYSTPLQAIEEMFFEMDVMLVSPIENTEILARTENHFIENLDRDIDSFDDI